MHRDLKETIVNNVMTNMSDQQKVFDRFIYIFNFERPHEALGMKRPAEVYVPSNRPMPKRTPRPEYESHWETRKVSDGGMIRWKGEPIFIGHAFTGETIAFEPTAVELFSVHYYKFVIGKLDENNGEFI